MRALWQDDRTVTSLKDSGADKDGGLAVYERSSPDLLANTPSEAETQKPDRDWPKMRGHLERELTSLRNWRTSWWDGPWGDIAKFQEPIRSTFLTMNSGGYPNPNGQTRGRELNRNILDPTGQQAGRKCAAGLMSGLASPSRPWFKLVPAVSNAKMDDAAHDWFDETQSRMSTVMQLSNFYNSFALECLDLVNYGTSPVLIYEDEKDVIRLYNAVVGEYFLGTDSTMRIGRYARNFVLDTFQLVGMFGLENLPTEVQNLWTQKGSSLSQEQSVAQIIEPNYEVNDGGQFSFGKVKGPFTWREVYWLYGKATAAPLSVRGFRGQPFTASRWITQSNDAYGHSLAMDALPDIKTLQVLMKRYQQALEKVVNPPLLADIALKDEPASGLPGGVTFVPGLDAKTGMRPIYQINPDLNHCWASVMDVRGRIEKGFYIDLFLMLENMAGKQMTAYEVGQRMQEKLQVLGPVIENLLNESLKPKLKRIYSIMANRGLLPPKPPSLQTVPIDVEFTSMLAVAQKAAATGGIERLVEMLGKIIGWDPSVADNVDMDETMREYNDLLSNPQKIMRAEGQVQQMRTQRQAQAAQQQRLQAIHQGGLAAVQAAKTMSDTSLGQGSALDAVVGQAGGAGGAQAMPNI